jgi:hypothetical protein
LFESIKGRTDGTAMRHPNAIIVPDKCCNANGLAWLEGKIPSGAMPQLLSALRFDGVLVFDQLLARERMLTFRQPIERLTLHRTS